MPFPKGIRKRENPKVEEAAFPGAALVDLADIERSGALAVEHAYPWKTHGKAPECRVPQLTMRLSGGSWQLFLKGIRKSENPKVEGAAFPGAILVDLAEIERSGALAVEHTHGKTHGKAL